MKVAWWFNLDADREFERPDSRERSSTEVQRIDRYVEILRGVVEPGDIVVERNSAGLCLGNGFLGQAWSPTPTALQVLKQARVRVPVVPDFEVLRRVNHRAFSASFETMLPGGGFVRSPAEMRALLEVPSAFPDWLCKRPHGFAGIGHRRVRRDDFLRDGLTFNDNRWLRKSFEELGGLQVEPLVDRVADLALHGWVFAPSSSNVRGDREATAPSLALFLGVATLQRCDEQGRWQNSAAATREELGEADVESWTRLAEKIGGELARQGYWGPFGIDAFHWRDPAGRIRFHPLSEINARYTMGWFTGMAAWNRQDLWGSVCAHS